MTHISDRNTNSYITITKRVHFFTSHIFLILSLYVECAPSKADAKTGDRIFKGLCFSEAHLH